jgi:type I site-specific restriction endonuclease
MPTEADTSRTLITPQVQATGWDSDPASIAKQRFFTAGRIVLRGNQAERRKGKCADYSATTRGSSPLRLSKQSLRIKRLLKG